MAPRGVKQRAIRIWCVNFHIIIKVTLNASLQFLLLQCLLIISEDFYLDIRKHACGLSVVLASLRYICQHFVSLLFCLSVGLTMKIIGGCYR